jgi:putative hydrolase of the HAD superfamily
MDMPVRTPRYLFFDVGNVLLTFCPQRVARQMGEVAGVPASHVWDIVYESGLLEKHERGELASRDFYNQFCDSTGTRPEFDRLCFAASDIFNLNVAVIPIVAHLSAAGQRLGILSNTNETHWTFISSGRFTVLRRYFEHYVLSHEVRAAKPDAKIYRIAAEMTGFAPEEIFFVDDRQENVLAARDAGFDAIPYVSAPALAEALRQRNVRFNY